ncbi:flagellar biosynthetic protein FliO [Pinirhizobacter sp.]|jgi:flagellar protein FliO/FliZ|uniref:flagellar biosynthetic protein FliO n=1 Tax=Pinirhizobacter sp. TaxID=2950432 RepID=UPI002F40E706
MKTVFASFGALLMAAAPGMLRAAPAAMAAPAPINTGAELLRVVLSLAGIVAMIFVAGWLTRRAQARVRPGGRKIRVIETMPVGVKEKVMLMEVGGTQLLVGASPSGLRTLHVLATPIVEDTTIASTLPPSFRDILGQWGKR